MKQCFVLLFLGLSALAFCQDHNLMAGYIDQPALAFPTAEGFGKYSIGGRGGKVFIVSNLNDSGPGSFREAAEAKEPRTIVFEVSGTIHLESPLNIRGHVTIAGQTAPGDGICLADHPVILDGDHIIVRYLRFRAGGKSQGDALTGTGRKNIILDHCSISWGRNAVFSLYGGDSTSLQWNLVAEPLIDSSPTEKGQSNNLPQVNGGTWGGKHFSAHHNLLAHCGNGTPLLGGPGTEKVDFRNNVIYDWAEHSVYAGNDGDYNIVNNYYKFGPSSEFRAHSCMLNLRSNPSPGHPGQWLIEGNYVDGYPDVSDDNWKGVVIEKEKKSDLALLRADTAFYYMASTTQDAKSAFQSVLADVGCRLPGRDTIDKRILREVVERTGKLVYVQDAAFEKAGMAWPTLLMKDPLPDSDRDGMPDEWEIKMKLNPKDPSDAVQFTFSNKYTNLERYLNSIAP